MIGTIKLIAGGLLALCSSYVGFLIKKHYGARLEFFKQAKKFSEIMKGEVSFKKTPLPVVIENFSVANPSKFSIMLNEFMQWKKDNLTYKQMFSKLDNYHLRETEKEALLSFLTELGKSSLSDQLGIVAKAETEFTAKQKQCEDEYKRYGNTYFKLAVLIGIAIIVILA